MSTAKTHKLLLERVGAMTGTVLCAVLLDLPTKHALADGVDGLGRSIFLVGRHLLGDTPEAAQIVAVVLAQLAQGERSTKVHAVEFAPKASEAIAAAIDGPIEEVLCHGPRKTGKTHTLAAAGLINAEWHLRAGFPAPFKIAWLHDSLISASGKTGQSLELPVWGGLWTLKQDRTIALFSLQGKDLVRGEFVGCKDESSAERLRQEVHMVMAEELIASLTDGTGITEDQYRLGRSSARLETRRTSTVCATNPGAPDSWPCRYFGIQTDPKVLPGRLPTRLAVQIPPDDRLSPEEQAKELSTFAGSPTLQKRLAQGEWVMVEQGAAVAEGFDELVHTTKQLLVPHDSYLLGIGWDGGGSPTAVIGQNQFDQCQLYAALNLMPAGTEQLIEEAVRPWLQTFAPWALRDGGASLVHIIDPNMKTASQSSINDSAEKMIVSKLGGRIVYGPVRWPPRREAVLGVLRPGNVHGRVPLLIVRNEYTEPLIHALNGRWFYPIKDDGQVDRSGPKKPNSPWADYGDAAAYLLGWLKGGDMMQVAPREVKIEMAFSLEPSADQTFAL